MATCALRGAVTGQWRLSALRPLSFLREEITNGENENGENENGENENGENENGEKEIGKSE
jgi:hypothetical protein